MNITDITPIAIVLISLAAAFASVMVIPWLRSKLDAQEMANLLRWVEIGVAAAEQLYRNADPRWKKDYVVKFLNSKGYVVNGEDLENAIEAAVLKLHQELYGGGGNAKQP